MSFRARGAWTCRAPTLDEKKFDDDGQSPDQIARSFWEWADATASAQIGRLTGQRYSDLIKGNVNFRERGAYTTTFVTALINEGALEEALRIAQEVRSGQRRSVENFVCNGSDFFGLAAERLRARIEAERR